MRWKTSLEIADHVSHIKAIEVAGGVDISCHKPGMTGGTLTEVRRRRTAFEVGYGISYIKAVEVARVVGIAGNIRTIGAGHNQCHRQYDCAMFRVIGDNAYLGVICA